MVVHTNAHRASPRTRLGIATALTMLGLTLAFGWTLLLDWRLYGALPDPSLPPIQALLTATTLVAATRWRWAPLAAAVVSLMVGIGSAVQPITMVRLTNPDSIEALVATVLVLAFAAATAVTGLAAGARTVRAGRRQHAP